MKNAQAMGTLLFAFERKRERRRRDRERRKKIGGKTFFY